MVAKKWNASMLFYLLLSYVVTPCEIMLEPLKGQQQVFTVPTSATDVECKTLHYNYRGTIRASSTGDGAVYCVHNCMVAGCPDSSHVTVETSNGRFIGSKLYDLNAEGDIPFYATMREIGANREANEGGHWGGLVGIPQGSTTISVMDDSGFVAHLDSPTFSQQWSFSDAFTLNGVTYGVPYMNKNLLKISIDSNNDDRLKFEQEGNYVGAFKWATAVVVGQSAYLVPYLSTKVLKVPEDIQFGSNVDGYWGGVHCGEYIVLVPAHANVFAKIKISDDTVTFFGANILPEIVHIGEYLFTQQAFCYYDRVYMSPYDYSKVVCVNPIDETIQELGPDLGMEMERKYSSLIATAWGIIGIPNSATQILKINPETDDITFFGSITAIEDKWSYGIVSPHRYGRVIIAIPKKHIQILIINVEDETLEYSAYPDIDPLITDRFGDPIIRYSGQIYATPREANEVLEIGTPICRPAPLRTQEFYCLLGDPCTIILDGGDQRPGDRIFVGCLDENHLIAEGWPNNYQPLAATVQDDGSITYELNPAMRALNARTFRLCWDPEDTDTIFTQELGVVHLEGPLYLYTPKSCHLGQECVLVAPDCTIPNTINVPCQQDGEELFRIEGVEEFPFTPMFHAGTYTVCWNVVGSFGILHLLGPVITDCTCHLSTTCSCSYPGMGITDTHVSVKYNDCHGDLVDLGWTNPSLPGVTTQDADGENITAFDFEDPKRAPFAGPIVVCWGIYSDHFVYAGTLTLIGPVFQSFQCQLAIPCMIAELEVNVKEDECLPETAMVDLSPLPAGTLPNNDLGKLDKSLGTFRMCWQDHLLYIGDITIVDNKCTFGQGFPTCFNPIKYKICKPDQNAIVHVVDMIKYEQCRSYDATHIDCNNIININACMTACSLYEKVGCCQFHAELATQEFGGEGCHFYEGAGMTLEDTASIYSYSATCYPMPLPNDADPTACVQTSHTVTCAPQCNTGYTLDLVDQTRTFQCLRGEFAPQTFTCYSDCFDTITISGAVNSCAGGIHGSICEMECPVNGVHSDDWRCFGGVWLEVRNPNVPGHLRYGAPKCFEPCTHNGTCDIDESILTHSAACPPKCPAGKMSRTRELLCIDGVMWPGTYECHPACFDQPIVANSDFSCLSPTRNEEYCNVRCLDAHLATKQQISCMMGVWEEVVCRKPCDISTLIVHPGVEDPCSGHVTVLHGSECLPLCEEGWTVKERFQCDDGVFSIEEVECLKKCPIGPPPGIVPNSIEMFCELSHTFSCPLECDWKTIAEGEVYCNNGVLEAHGACYKACIRTSKIVDGMEVEVCQEGLHEATCPLDCNPDDAVLGEYICLNGVWTVDGYCGKPCIEKGLLIPHNTTYECPDGYQLVDTATQVEIDLVFEDILCLNGLPDRDDPVECAPLFSCIASGTDRFALGTCGPIYHGETCTLSCQSGYSGSITARCEWEELIYTGLCYPTFCGQLPIIENSEKVLPPDTRAFGGKAEVVCIPRTALPNQKTAITCLDTGEWSTENCEFIQCGPLPNYDGIVWTEEVCTFSIKSRCNFLCEDGYQGGGKYICRSTGDWTLALKSDNLSVDGDAASSQKCLPSDCLWLPVFPLSVQRDCDTALKHGESCVITCPDPLEATDLLKCAFGEYSIPTCLLPDGTILPPNSDLQVHKGFLHRIEVQYTAAATEEFGIFRAESWAQTIGDEIIEQANKWENTIDDRRVLKQKLNHLTVKNTSNDYLVLNTSPILKNKSLNDYSPRTSSDKNDISPIVPHPTRNPNQILDENVYMIPSGFDPIYEDNSDIFETVGDEILEIPPHLYPRYDKNLENLEDNEQNDKGGRHLADIVEEVFTILARSPVRMNTPKQASCEIYLATTRKNFKLPPLRAPSKITKEYDPVFITFTIPPNNELLAEDLTQEPTSAPAADIITQSPLELSDVRSEEAAMLQSWEMLIIFTFIGIVATVVLICAIRRVIVQKRLRAQRIQLKKEEEARAFKKKFQKTASKSMKLLHNDGAKDGVPSPKAIEDGTLSGEGSKAGSPSRRKAMILDDGEDGSEKKNESENNENDEKEVDSEGNTIYSDDEDKDSNHPALQDPNQSRVTSPTSPQSFFPDDIHKISDSFFSRKSSIIGQPRPTFREKKKEMIKNSLAAISQSDIHYIHSVHGLTHKEDISSSDFSDLSEDETSPKKTTVLEVDDEIFAQDNNHLFEGQDIIREKKTKLNILGRLTLADAPPKIKYRRGTEYQDDDDVKRRLKEGLIALEEKPPDGITIDQIETQIREKTGDRKHKRIIAAKRGRRKSIEAKSRKPDSQSSSSSNSSNASSGEDIDEKEAQRNLELINRRRR